MKKRSVIPMLFTTLVLAGCGGSGGGSDTGNVVTTTNSDANFVVLSSDAVRAKNTEEWVDYMELQLFAALSPLNEINGLLPRTMVVNYDECGFVNAFYQAATQSITICDEFVDSVISFWSTKQPDDAINFTARSVNHVLYHEIGHALVDVLNIPSLGNSESVADGIAAVLAGETGRSFDAVISSEWLADSASSFAGIHINGVDRQGDIICWAAGSDSRILFNSSLASYISEFLENGRDCVAFYEEQLSSVIALVPKFTALTESDITNPDIIALGNPSPTKQAELQNNFALGTALRNEADDLWGCTASLRENRVLYVFREATGAYRESVDGADTFQFQFATTSSTSVRLDYTEITFTEVINQINFINVDLFTASSDSEGTLRCERGVNVAA